MTGPPRVLLLGGTTEASAIAAALAERTPASVDLVTSFAGRTSAPTIPPGRVRTGGFGGTDGLAAYLRTERIDAVIDALHPFAAVMPFHAHRACETADVPLVKVVRPPWAPAAGDRWTAVAAMGDVPGALAELGAERVLLTVGRQDLDPFRTVVGVRFTVRSIEPPDLSGAWDATTLLTRGPFTLDDELDLLRAEQIDAVVTKNSGGSATAAKLAAAGQLGLPVVVVARPPTPPVATVATVDGALAWLAGLPLRS